MQDLKHDHLNASAVSLVYSWWCLLVQLVNLQFRVEAITSQPFLLLCVAPTIRQTEQQRLVLSHTHR